LLDLGEVEILGPYEPKFRLFFAKIFNQLCLIIFKKRYSYRHSSFISKGYANYFNKKLESKQFDFIVAPAASCELAYINTKIPIIYITDGTFASCLNYHKALSNLIPSCIKDGNLIEQRAINNSTYTLVSSNWAANSVINDYDCNSNKVLNFPYGANFENLPLASEINYTAPKTWKLLFVGVYWDSKGGEYAYNCFKILIDKGLDIELTVLGCDPPLDFKHPKMKVISFIDKNSKQGQEKLFSIFKEHHLLILPTRFDCTPIVINEASAFAIPCVVAKTGGVEGHLKQGINGYLVDYNDTGKGYAEVIEKIISSPENYIALKKSTRHLYDEKLNWNAWKNELVKIISLNK
jgi:glycosyltransferase involved in cell wall biosynthesis